MFSGDSTRLTDRFTAFQLLHKDILTGGIAINFDGLHKADYAPLVRNPETATLGILKEVPYIVQWGSGASDVIRYQGVGAQRKQEGQEHKQ
jgi:hypothetical protein